MIAAAAGDAADDLPFMRERVDLDAHLRFEWRAFSLLSSERQIGMGVGPIPWRAVEAYAAANQVDGQDERERFHSLIRAMDGAYLGHLSAKNEN